MGDINEGKARDAFPSYFHARIGLPFLLFIMIQFACATPAQVMRETSRPTRPEWIDRPPHGNEILHFVGIKTSAETFEEGRDAAIRNAMSKVSDYLGSKVESIFEEHVTEIEQKLRQQITTRSSAAVHGAKVVDSYYEKLLRIDKNFRMEKYDVYVLISFSKAEAAKEVERQQKEKREQAQIAYDFYLKGVDCEKNDRYYDARNFYSEALGILTGIEDVIEVGGKDVKNSRDLLLILKTRLQNVNLKLSQVMLSIKVNGPPKAHQVFTSSFISALNGSGFTITDEQPAINISGEISVTESSYVMNNFVYYAEGSVTAIRTSDQQKVAVLPFRVKGFHRSREQAALNALAEAGIEAGNGLSKTILEKEKAGIAGRKNF